MMFWKLAVLAIGVIELVFPRQFVDFWMRRATPDGDTVELRPWVYHAARIEGLLIIAWVLAKYDADTDGLGEELDRFTSRLDTETSVSTPVSIAEAPTDTDTDTRAQDLATDLPTLNPGTRRYELAAVLYHAGEPVTVADVIEHSAGTDWEQTRSGASAELYKMYNDDIVDRQEREDTGRYEYWLTDQGRTALEASPDPIEPNPFAD